MQTTALVTLGLLYLVAGAFIVSAGETLARWLAHKHEQPLSSIRRKIVLWLDVPFLLLLLLSGATSLYFLLKPLI